MEGELKIRETVRAVSCPECGMRALLADVPTTWVPMEDGKVAMWGDPSAAVAYIVRQGAVKLRCNGRDCGWEGTYDQARAG